MQRKAKLKLARKRRKLSAQRQGLVPQECEPGPYELFDAQHAGTAPPALQDRYEWYAAKQEQRQTRHRVKLLRRQLRKQKREELRARREAHKAKVEKLREEGTWQSVE